MRGLVLAGEVVEEQSAVLQAVWLQKQQEGEGALLAGPCPWPLHWLKGVVLMVVSQVE